MTQNHSKSEEVPSNCCSKASSELKLYQTFIFTIPILLIFFLLLLFYLFYLRRRRVNWRSLHMRTSVHHREGVDDNDITRCGLGLKKEHREMLPIIIFKESFSVKDTQCPVCLADYQAEERLQQIPACGHTFHMCCIDLWLATNPTCPLCRLSLIPSSKPSDRLSDPQDTSHVLFSSENRVDTTFQGHPEWGHGDVSHNMRN